MEWVYNGSSDEPTLFEGDSHGSSASTRPSAFDIFSSSSAVEDEPRSECEAEAEYYGSSDEPDDLLAPEDAFLKFAHRSTAAKPNADFSSAIYAEAAAKHVPRSLPRRNPAIESRKERIARIATELDALAQETGIESEQPTDSVADLSALREQLHSIEAAAAAPHQPRARLLLQRDSGALDDRAKSQTGLTVQMVSPDVGAVSALEKRVAAVERSVGVSHLSEVCDGKSMAGMLDDVQNRLEFVTDRSLPERLKSDARDIAEILQKELQSEHGADVVKTATVLEKMEKWEQIADTVPLVVERLRCFKKLQDEAGQFIVSLAALGKQVDSLAKTSEINGKLIANVSRNLEANCNTVQENLNILERKLTGDLGCSS